MTACLLLKHVFAYQKAFGSGQSEIDLKTMNSRAKTVENVEHFSNNVSTF